MFELQCTFELPRIMLETQCIKLQGMRIMYKAQRKMAKEPRIMLKVQRIMFKAPHIKFKAQRTMTKVPHILLEAHRIMFRVQRIMLKSLFIMLKSPCIMLKSPCIMLKSPSKMVFDHLRQLWLSIQYSSWIGCRVQGFLKGFSIPQMQLRFSYLMINTEILVPLNSENLTLLMFCNSFYNMVKETIFSTDMYFPRILINVAENKIHFIVFC